jgi:hypothetical protein
MPGCRGQPNSTVSNAGAGDKDTYRAAFDMAGKRDMYQQVCPIAYKCRSAQLQHGAPDPRRMNSKRNISSFHVTLQGPKRISQALARIETNRVSICCHGHLGNAMASSQGVHPAPRTIVRCDFPFSMLAMGSSAVAIAAKQSFHLGLGAGGAIQEPRLHAPCSKWHSSVHTPLLVYKV